MEQNECALKDKSKMEEILSKASQEHFGVLHSRFLKNCISVLSPKPPICVKDSDSIDSVMLLLQENAIGCVMIVDGQGKLLGIFGERDFMLKIYGKAIDLSETPVSEFMTREPVTVDPDTRIAYALNLMSQLGFRHLPVVNDDNIPLSIVSIKDIVDYLVNSMVEDLLKYEV